MFDQAMIVPWRNPEEFKTVYKFLYDTEIARKQWAVNKITCWESRCWPTLPKAVESTGTFVSAQIQDALNQTNHSLCKTSEIETMYSMAVVRFVNLCLESGKYPEKKKLATKAKEKGLPSFLIDVRHNITHGRTPTIDVLRMTCKLVMDYLEKTFWIPESERMKPLVKTFDEGPLKKSLESYRKISMQIVKRGSMDEKPKFEEDLILTRKQIKIVNNMGKYLNKPPSEQRKFIELLVHPDYFVREEDIYMIKETDEIFIFGKVDKTTRIPGVISLLWLPILVLLHKFDLVPDFLEALLFSQENRNIKIFQKVVDFYVISVIDLSVKMAPDYDNPFLNKGVFINELRLLYACMRGASIYSDAVFEKISTKLDMGAWKDELSAILMMKRGLTSSKVTQKPKRGQKRKIEFTFTVGDLEDDIRNEMVRLKPKLKRNKWFLCPVDIDFSQIMCGHVFNPKPVEKDLILKECEKVKKEIKVESESPPYKMECDPVEDIEPIHEPEFEKYLFNRVPPQRTSFIYTKRRN